MKFEMQSYDAAAVRAARDDSNEAPKINGYPIFNDCGHTTIDMSNLLYEAPGERHHTLSIKVANDVYLAVCVVPMLEEQNVCIDMKLFSEDENRVQRAIHFDPEASKDTHIEKLNILTMISAVNNRK